MSYSIFYVAGVSMGSGSRIRVGLSREVVYLSVFSRKLELLEVRGLLLVVKRISRLLVPWPLLGAIAVAGERLTLSVEGRPPRPGVFRRADAGADGLEDLAPDLSAEGPPVTFDLPVTILGSSTF